MLEEMHDPVLSQPICQVGSEPPLLSSEIYLCMFRCVWSLLLFSTANIKALRGSLGALSVNKLSHIPKLQPISAVYENQ